MHCTASATLAYIKNGRIQLPKNYSELEQYVCASGRNDYPLDYPVSANTKLTVPMQKWQGCTGLSQGCSKVVDNEQPYDHLVTTLW